MRTRNNVVVIHLDDREYQKLNAACHTAHMSREAYLRELIENGVIYVRDPKEYATLSKQITAYERNINQIAHVANLTGRVEAEMIRVVQTSVAEIRKWFQEKL